MTTLRPYQREAIDAAREHLRAARSTLVVLPTGGGKTVIFAAIAKAAIEKGRRVLVLAHRSELLDQAIAKIRAVAPHVHVGREQAESRARHGEVIVASVQTLHRSQRLRRWAPEAFGLIVVDEAHHAAAESYQRILEHFASAKILGFTATPDRADGVGLRKTFPTVAYSRSMLDLVRDGYLVPIRGRVVRVDGFDVAGVKVVAGDLQDRGLVAALDQPGVLEAIAQSLVRDSEGRSTLVFVPGVKLAHELAELLEEADCGGAVAVDGETDAEVRAARFARFAAGKVRFLVNVGVATEGTDVPRCSCVAVVRPTMSRSLFVQMVGRGARLFEGKVDNLVLNYAPSNCRHALMVPVDAMLGDDVDDATRAVVRELAEEDPQLGLDDLLERATERVRSKRVASIRSAIEEWDPLGLLELRDVSSGAPGLGFLGSQVSRAADECRKGGVPERTLQRLGQAETVELARAIKARSRAGLCSIKQAKQLARRGLNPNCSRAAAGRAMAAISARGWDRPTPPDLYADPELAMPKETAA